MASVTQRFLLGTLSKDVFERPVKGSVVYVFRDSQEQTVVQVRTRNKFYCTVGLNHAFKERSALGPWEEWGIFSRNAQKANIRFLFFPSSFSFLSFFLSFIGHSTSSTRLHFSGKRLARKSRRSRTFFERECGSGSVNKEDFQRNFLVNCGRFCVFLCHV